MAGPSAGYAFDGKSERAMRLARAAGSKLVTNITEETRDALRAAMRKAIKDGTPPQEAARQIIGILKQPGATTNAVPGLSGLLGLNAPQVQAALNYRASLIDLGHTPAKIDQLMGRYVKGKLRERSMMIARTESVRAANLGAESAFIQAQKQGYLPPNARLVWITTPDEKRCPICAAMSGKTKPIGREEFAGPYGPISPPAHPHCRCTVALADRVKTAEQSIIMQDSSAYPQTSFLADHGNSPNLTGNSWAKHFIEDADGPWSFEDNKGKLWTGRLTPERQALMDAIDRVHFRGMSPVDNPFTEVLGGGPASGKGTIDNLLSASGKGLRSTANKVRMDPDVIRAMLPEMREAVDAAAKLEGWSLRYVENLGAAATHNEAAAIGEKVMEKALNGGYNFLHDGTGDGSWAKFQQKVIAYKTGGRMVEAHYFTVDLETARKRAYARGQKSGRFVPDEIMDKTHANVSRTVEKLSRGEDGVTLDLWRLWDNNSRPPVLVAEGHGDLFDVFDPERWAAFIAKGA